MKNESKIYFPGLNGLRFFAASAVIISHVELVKSVFGLKSYWNEPMFFNLGGLGVYFFFVLSGFLITYLLLVEKQKTNSVEVKKFYLRRVLRIWPLYYFILILGFFVLPYFPQIKISYLEASFNEFFYQNLVLYILILPNLAFSMYPAVPHIGQAWSIGVEEQFYFFWPWLIKKSKNILKSLIAFIFIIILLKVIVLFLPLSIQKLYWYIPLKRFLAMSKLESMAIGGIGAYVIFNKITKLQNLIYNQFVFMGSLFAIPFIVYYSPDAIQDGIHLVYSVLFLIIISNVSSGKNLWLKLENKVFRFLGNISYGIYMYHLIIIPIVVFLYKRMNLNFGSLPENVIIYLFVFTLTILISGASYYLLEERFIKWKSKFSIIKSGQ